jgi:hypothetical protein
MLSTLPGLLAAILPSASLLAVLTALAAQAGTPNGAVITAATANTNIMVKRPSLPSIPASVNLQLRNLDTLTVPAQSRSRASLRTLGPDLSVHLFGLSRRTSWRLPCTASGDGFVQWGSGIQRGCVPYGVAVRPNLERLSAASRSVSLIASAAPLSSPIDVAWQLPPVLFHVCSATTEAGDKTASVIMPGFLNPCAAAIQKCEQQASTPCLVVSEGTWTSSSSQAFAICGANVRRLENVEAIITFLRSLGGDSTDCAIQVLERGDLLLVPEGDARTVVAFETDDSGAAVTVIEGTIKALANRTEDWVSLSTGETFMTRDGERKSARDWLQQSELCAGIEQLTSPPLEQFSPAVAQRAADPGLSLLVKYCQL